jgi:hypothetical protein
MRDIMDNALLPFESVVYVCSAWYSKEWVTYSDSEDEVWGDFRTPQGTIETAKHAGSMRGTSRLGLDTEALIDYQGQPVMPDSKAELLRLRDEAKEAGYANHAMLYDAALSHLEVSMARHPDGPDGGHLFWHDNADYKPTGLRMRLIKALYGNRWVGYVRLGDEIWGDTYKSAETIQTLVRRTNAWFKREELPYFVSRDQERLILKQEP